MPHVVGQLGPIKPGLPEQRRLLAEALRAMFNRHTPPAVRIYAAKKSINASTVSRYLNGWTLPSEEFIEDLIDAVEQQVGGTLREELDHLRRLLYNAQDSLPGTWSHRKNLQERARRAQHEAAVAILRAEDLETENRMLRDRVELLLRSLSAFQEQNTTAPPTLSQGKIEPRIAATSPLTTDGSTRTATNSASAEREPPTSASTTGYWPAYAQALLVRGWTSSTVTGLDSVTNDVISRLSDPFSPKPHPVRGEISILPGSGKTANIVATITKAADAGSRLVIVLAGTLEATRRQLQESIDRELSTAPNVVWLTHSDMDYQRLASALMTLHFEKADREKSLNTKENLASASLRIVVVKRNSTVLRKLLNDLNAMPTPPGEIPALVIDSDPSSNPTSTVDKFVARLLDLLPRADYLAYSTEPFGSSLRLPGDPLTPSDFIVAAPRPPGYLEPEDFTSSRATNPAQGPSTSHGRTRLRRVEPGPEGLRAALDMFVLGGAVKCYRESISGMTFSRHTMLLGTLSYHNDKQASLHDRLLDVWNTGGYTDGTGWSRLHLLFEHEVAPSDNGGADSAPVPESFEALTSELERAVHKITRPTPGQYRPAAAPPWSIVAASPQGVHSLSHDGLTVLYLDGIGSSYRSAWRLAASLFGLHPGYSDLVRLYVPVASMDHDPLTDLFAAWAEWRRSFETLDNLAHLKSLDADE